MFKKNNVQYQRQREFVSVSSSHTVALDPKQKKAILKDEMNEPVPVDLKNVYYIYAQDVDVSVDIEDFCSYFVCKERGKRILYFSIYNKKSTQFTHKQVKAPNNDEIVEISGNAFVTMFLGKRGKLYYQLNAEMESELALVEVEVAVHQIVSVAKGNNFTVLLDKCGQVFVTGSYHDEPCSLESTQNEMESFSKLEKVSVPGRVTSIKAGFGHFLLLTSKGDVYARGRNDCDQLGYSEFRGNSWNIGLKKIDTKGEKIGRIAAGKGISMLLTRKGVLLNCGQLRVDMFELNRVHQDLLRKYEFGEKILDMCVSHNNAVYVINSQSKAYNLVLGVGLPDSLVPKITLNQVQMHKYEKEEATAEKEERLEFLMAKPDSDLGTVATLFTY